MPCQLPTFQQKSAIRLAQCSQDTGVGSIRFETGHLRDQGLRNAKFSSLYITTSRRHCHVKVSPDLQVLGEEAFRVDYRSANISTGVVDVIHVRLLDCVLRTHICRYLSGSDQ